MICLPASMGLVRPALGGGGDPFIAFRKTIANLNVNLSDPFRAWTANGDAAVVGGWLSLDGAGDYISTPNSADFNLGTGDFCLEAFLEIAGSPGGDVAIMAKWQVGTLSWFMGLNAFRRLTFYNQISGSLTFPATTGSVPLSTMTHVAVYRVGSTFYGAIAGVVEVLLTSAGALDTVSLPTSIGADSSGTSNFFAGKIKGVRATKGSSGGYGASNFTPPTFPLPTS